MQETLQLEVDTSILKRLEILEGLIKNHIDDILFLTARIEKIEYVIGLKKPNK